MEILVLLFQCQDKKGIVAKVSEFIYRHNGNIITADQHTTNPKNGHFFMRVEFLVEESLVNTVNLEKELIVLAEEFNADYKLFNKARRLRMGIFVSKAGHCLNEILYLWRIKELHADITFVASNYDLHRNFVEQLNIPFYFIPAKKEDRKENAFLELASKNTDFLVLARYMLVLSPEFLKSYAKDIINIHHGFLPSFRGANPYRQAIEEGVKVIGATAHFVTEKLDCGPIISQAVEDVTHKDDLNDLIRKGRNLEKRALQEAISAYLDYRIIKHGNRTIVF